MDEDSDNKKTVFFGPAQNNWYKYKTAQIAVKITINSPLFRKTSVGNFIFNWGIKNTIGARETETINEKD